MEMWKKRELQKCIDVIEQLRSEKREGTFSYGVMMAYYGSLIGAKSKK